MLVSLSNTQQPVDTNCARPLNLPFNTSHSSRLAKTRRPHIASQHILSTWQELKKLSKIGACMLCRVVTLRTESAHQPLSGTGGVQAQAEAILIIAGLLLSTLRCVFSTPTTTWGSARRRQAPQGPFGLQASKPSLHPQGYWTPNLRLPSPNLPQKGPKSSRSPKPFTLSLRYTRSALAAGVLNVG